MIVSPYDLILNESIFAKIVAQNTYGDSAFSDAGNGGLVKLVPDAPINLQNDPVTTDAFKIKFTWQEGVSNGGMPVIDFDIYYDKGTSSWELLEEAVSDLFYTTTVALTPDVIYSFKVTARNSVGDSLQSEPVAIRAAKVPDAPVTLTNVPEITTAYQVGLAWSEGAYNGGSAVLDYRVSQRAESDSTFTLVESNIVLTQLIVTGLTPAVSYEFRVEARNLVGYSSFSDSITVLAA